MLLLLKKTTLELSRGVPVGDRRLQTISINERWKKNSRGRGQN
jgi:hypothetical protein